VESFVSFFSSPEDVVFSSDSSWVFNNLFRYSSRSLDTLSCLISLTRADWRVLALYGQISFPPFLLLLPPIPPTLFFFFRVKFRPLSAFASPCYQKCVLTFVALVFKICHRSRLLLHSSSFATPSPFPPLLPPLIHVSWFPPACRFSTSFCVCRLRVT
jgi:hypothetical protein